MSLLHTKSYSSWVRGHLLCRVEGVEGRFALTFDDGPSRDATPRILDVLGRHGARATFFLLAGNVRREPGVVRRMVTEGHEPALHGDAHWPLPLLPPGLIRREVESAAASLAAIGVESAHHYRPPFGFMTPGQAGLVRRLGYEPVLGDVYPEDAHRPGVARIVARVVPRLRPGSILILHDGSPLGELDRSQTVAAADIILERAAAMGLTAVSVRELLEAAPAAG
jgi:peptidoglycan/xylan/chitin deacetylase (PgdA/CDA1 family)